MINVVKWVGTVCVILAAISRSLGYHSMDMFLSILGALIWAYAAIRMKDNALVTINAFILVILLYGVLK